MHLSASKFFNKKKKTQTRTKDGLYSYQEEKYNALQIV